jgi:hypothetical protein
LPDQQENEKLEGSDEWGDVIYYKSFTPFHFDINKYFSEWKLFEKFFQSVKLLFDLIVIAFLLYCALNTITRFHGDVEVERSRWVDMIYLLLSIALLWMIISLRLSEKDLGELVSNHRFNARLAHESGTNIKIEYKNLRVIRTLAFVLVLFIANILKFILGTIDNITTNESFEHFIFTLILHLFFICAEILYVSISWMICSRFRHLNKTIENLIEKKERTIKDLQAFVNWYSQNLKQMRLFNGIFSSIMPVYFLVYLYCQVVLIEDEIVLYTNDKETSKVHGLLFIVFNCCIFTYIVKQTNDTTKEASKTAEFFKEYGNSRIMDREFNRKVMA